VFVRQLSLAILLWIDAMGKRNVYLQKLERKQAHRQCNSLNPRSAHIVNWNLAKGKGNGDHRRSVSLMVQEGPYVTFVRICARKRQDYAYESV